MHIELQEEWEQSPLFYHEERRKTLRRDEDVSPNWQKCQLKKRPQTDKYVSVEGWEGGL